VREAAARSLPGDPGDPGRAAAGKTLVIRPSRGWVPLQLNDLWEYRELLYFLVWRDVKVRYKQTLLGASWAILQPLLTMLIFTIFFGGLARVGSDGLPYPLFSYAGVLPWTFFAQAVGAASGSLVGSANMLKKVYFPRLIMPLASVVAALVDFAIAFLVLFGLMAHYHVWPGVQALWCVPLLVLLGLAASCGVGLWLATLNVEYRDVRYVVPFLLQIWLFVTPVIYPTSRILDKLASVGIPEWLYGLNPMVGVVEGFRWALLGTGTRPFALIATSSVTSLVLLVSGAFYLRKMEKTFADVV
jgi:lipopolysaccharide transport system permease protein